MWLIKIIGWNDQLNKRLKLDGCIVWNAQNTVYGSKHSAICAQAVYFLHSTRSSVTWLDRAMSALSAVLSTRVGRHRKYGEVSCTECTGQGNNSELIPMVEMETIHPVEGYFGSEFLAICNHCRVMAAWSHKTLKNFQIFCVFIGKTNSYSKIFKILFGKVSPQHRSTCCVQSSLNLADGKSVKLCVAYLTKQNKISLAL